MSKRLKFIFKPFYVIMPLFNIGSTVPPSASGEQVTVSSRLLSVGSGLIWIQLTVNPDRVQTVVRADSIDVISRPSGSKRSHRIPVFHNNMLYRFPVVIRQVCIRPLFYYRMDCIISVQLILYGFRQVYECEKYIFINLAQF